jgi:hypothetical protein
VAVAAIMVTAADAIAGTYSVTGIGPGNVREEETYSTCAEGYVADYYIGHGGRTRIDGRRCLGPPDGANGESSFLTLKSMPHVSIFRNTNGTQARVKRLEAECSAGLRNVRQSQHNYSDTSDLSLFTNVMSMLHIGEFNFTSYLSLSYLPANHSQPVDHIAYVYFRVSPFMIKGFA